MNRQRLLILLAIGLAVYVALESSSYLQSADGRAQKASSDLSECRKYAAALSASDGAEPSPAAADGVADIRTAAEKLAANAGIKGLKSVDQRSPRRLEDSPYMERPYQIRLLKVTPMQIARFTHELSVLKGLNPVSINMQVALRDSAENLWNVDLEFTYLIYDPVETER